MISRLVVLVVTTCILLCSAAAITVRIWALGPSQSESQAGWKSLEHQAHSDYYSGKYRQAILLFKQLLQLDPQKKNPMVLTDLGNMEYELSNFTGALDYYKKALDISPQHIGALLGIGESLEKVGNRSAALTYYKQAVSVSPFLPSALAKQPSWLLAERADALTYLGNYSR